MTQSMSFSLPPSTPVGGVPSSEGVRHTPSLTPPDTLPSRADQQGKNTPPISQRIPALCSGQAMKTLMTTFSPNISKQELDELPAEKPQSAAALLALIDVAPVISLQKKSTAAGS